jgi:putative transcriptional regulator
MHYVWDSAKDALNRKKHGLALSDGIPAFEDPQRNGGSTIDSITAKSELSRWGLPIREFSMSAQPKQARKSPASSASGKPSQMNSHDIWVEHNPGDPPIDSGTDWDFVNALTEEQLYAAALSDPDSQPIPAGSEDDLFRLGLKRIVNTKKLRDRLGLTQEEFAARYRIPVGTLRDWEQGRKRPDAPARAYLTVIARDPHAVASLLGEAA